MSIPGSRGDTAKWVPDELGLRGKDGGGGGGGYSYVDREKMEDWFKKQHNTVITR